MIVPVMIIAALILQGAVYVARSEFDLTSALERTVIPYNYPVGQGDVLFIAVETVEIREYRVKVRTDGNILLPYLDPLHVEGMTSEEISDLLLEKYLAIYRKVYVNVDVSSPARIRVFVRGNIGKPGVYIVFSHTSMFEILQALKISTSPRHRRILHLRPPYEVKMSRESIDIGVEDESDWKETWIDPLAMSLKGHIGRDFLLKEGDVIDVKPPGKVVRITGTVRSGSFEILPGETLADLLELAGSLDPYKDLKNTVVERFDAEGNLERIILDLHEYAETGKVPEFELRHRDSIKVIDPMNRVYVLGSVESPGSFSYDHKLTIYDYLALAGAKGEAYLPDTLILRQPRDPNEPFSENEIIRINVKEFKAGDGPDTSYSIEPGDVIYVPSRVDRIDWRDLISILNTVFLGANVFIN